MVFSRLAILSSLAAIALAGPVPESSLTYAQADPADVPLPQQTLLPAVQWDWPLDDLRNLDPKDSAELHYTEDGVSNPEVEHLFASMSTTLRHNTVILEQSAFIDSVSCANNNVNVKFNSAKAFKYAIDAWNIEDLVLVTNTLDCGMSHEERSFWLIKDLKSDSSSNSIAAEIVEEIAVHDTLHDVEIVWGKHKPAQGSHSGAGELKRRQEGGQSGAATTTRGGPSTTTQPASTTTKPSAYTTTAPGSSSSSASTTSAETPGGTNEPGENSGSACGAAPGATIRGYPAADCGASNFDEALDKSIGYLGFEAAADWAKDIKDFAPGVEFDEEELEYDVGNMKRDLHKRRILKWFVKAVKKVASTAVKIALAPVRLATKAITAIPVVGKFIAKVTTFSPSLSGTHTLNLGPTLDKDTPWGKGALIFEKASSKGNAKADVALYCVDCGIRGEVELYGRAKFNVLAIEIQEVKAGVNADITAGLHLGLIASATYNDKKSKQLVRQAIPKLGIAIKGVFAAGCYVGVDAATEINIKAEGQALVGVAMAWPKFKAELNLLGDGKGSSVTGYEPKITRRVEASGLISATAKLSLPVSFNVGVEIVPLGKSGKLAVSLIEEPGLLGEVTAAGSIGTDTPASETCNNGIEYGLSFTNDVKIDLLGIKTIDLANYKKPIVKDCYKFGGATKEDPEGGAAPDTTDDGNSGTDESTGGSTEGGAEGSSAKFRHRVRRQEQPASGDYDIIVDKTPVHFNPDAGTADGSETIIHPEVQNDTEIVKMQQSGYNLAELAIDVQGFTYKTIIDTHKKFNIVPDKDGNFYVGEYTEGAKDTGLFGVTDDVAAVDAEERLIHYYPNTMQDFGISRIRLSEEEEIPNQTDMIVFKPVNTDESSATPNILMAVTTEQDIFTIVMCDFKNGATTQLFIVNSEEAIQTLQTDEELTYIVTGAPVQSCEPVSLIFGASSESFGNVPGAT